MGFALDNGVGQDFHDGSLLTLGIISPTDIPVQPTMPISPGGLLTLMSGALQTTQVVETVGHTLLNTDGTLNADPPPPPRRQ